MPKMIRVALYVRVSHEEQALHGYSIEAQKQALTDYAQKNDLYIVDYYVDEGQTARKSYAKRKEFVRLIDDVKSGQIDLILFIKLDRWFRNIRDYYKIQEILEKSNVNWKTIYENYDTSTASGRLHINIMLSVAQDEADRTSERIKFVFENKIKNGQYVSGSLPLGYKLDENKRPVVVPEEAEKVRDIFNYYINHGSKRSIVRYTREKYGKAIPFHMISRILSHSLYTGKYKEYESFCEPIITEDIYNQAQYLLSKNVKKTPTGRIYIFIGLLRCPLCGGSMTVYTSLQMRRGLEYRYIYYRCAKRYTSDDCNFAHTFREETIEEILLENVNHQINDYVANYAIKQKASQSPTANNILYERQKIAKRLEKLKDLYLDDLIEKDAYKREYEELNEKLKTLSIKKEPSKKLNTAVLQKLLSSDFKEIYAVMLAKEKQTFWRSIIKEIHIDPKTLKFKIIFL